MNSDNRTMIGVVGGMGPYAGLDLLKKIFDLIISVLGKITPYVMHLLWKIICLLDDNRDVMIFLLH